MKRKITGLLILAVLISMFSVTGCYKDDEARVTIHIERNDLIGQKPVQKKWFIDRILEFFSSPAYGTTGWQTYKINMKLHITSTSFDELIFDLPSGSTEYSTTIPVSNNVSFLITTEFYDSETSANQKNWGGTTIVDLTPGDQNITIQMKPMTWIKGCSPGSTDIQVNWENGGSISTYVTTYNIYRSDSINGPFVKRGSPDNEPPFYDSPVSMAHTYYYKVSTNSTYGESVLSDSFQFYNP